MVVMILYYFIIKVSKIRLSGFVLAIERFNRFTAILPDKIPQTNHFGIINIPTITNLEFWLYAKAFILKVKDSQSQIKS